MPTQKRLWRHDQTASAWLRQDSRQRGKEGAIGWPHQRAPLLPCEHDELMAQDEQLDVFAEVAAPAADQQPHRGREGEVGEGKQHSPILPLPATVRASRHRGARVRGQAIGCAAQLDLVFARARETEKEALSAEPHSPNRDFGTPHAHEWKYHGLAGADLDQLASLLGELQEHSPAH
jgi:hypothetical protein